MSFTIKKTTLHTVSCDGKKYACNGERIWVDGKLMYMFRNQFGLDQDIVVCEDIDIDSGSRLYHLETLPGQAPSFPEETAPKYLTFTANEDNSQIAMVYWIDGDVPQVDFNVEYRIGDGEWQTYVLQDDSETIEYIELDEGEYVQFRGENPNGFDIIGDGCEYAAYFDMSGSFAASGDITSLLNGVGGDVALPENCYVNMFNGCESLTTAPELPSTTLATNCYYRMFYCCTSLNSVTCLATDISANGCTTEWLRGVGANGTFTKATSMSDWTTGTNGIPKGWTVEDYSE